MLIMYSLFLFKRWVEDVLMYPLILLGRLIALTKPLKKEYDVYFFFPFYSVGGAEKVHSQIVRAVGNENCIIFFTRRSRNNLFLEEFQKSGCDIKDISKHTDDKWLYFVNIIYRGMIAGYINGQRKKPVVFNGQCNFGYKISPWIKKRIPQVELLHSFNNFSFIRIPFLPFYTKSIMISHQTIADHETQYKRLKIPRQYAGKIQYIQNGIVLPAEGKEKSETGKLVVLYVGRGTAEKRVHLVGEIAAKLQEKDQAVEIQFLGDVKDAIPTPLHSYCLFWGNQSDPAVIQSVYENAHILILTSVFEGFPMVIMEAMAKGLVIVSTAVGDIPHHIKEAENGFLIHSKTEAEIIEAGVDIISNLSNNRSVINKIGETNKLYASKHFAIEEFNKKYLRLFESLQQYE